MHAQFLITNKTPANNLITSRSDAFFGNNHVFNQSVFDTSTVYWTTDILTPKQIANSKLARQVTSRAYNPEYTFTTTTEEFSLGEVAAPFIVFGTLQDPTVEKKLVTYFFGMFACLNPCCRRMSLLTDTAWTKQRTSASPPSWDGPRRRHRSA